MSLPSTTTATVLFLTARPSWEDGIRVNQIMPGKVWTSRSGLEQRQQNRGLPSWRMEYRHNPATRREARQRLALMHREVAASMWVPWWADEYHTATIAPTGAGTVTLNTDPQTDFFLAGEYLCFDGAAGLEFRTVTSLSARVITMGGTGLAHPTGTRVYPCKLCLRTSPDAALAADLTADEKIVVASLQ